LDFLRPTSVVRRVEPGERAEARSQDEPEQEDEVEEGKGGEPEDEE